MSQQKESVLSDNGTERAVLSILAQNGSESFYDIADIISCSAFTNENNQAIFKCIDELVKKKQEIDIPTLISQAEEMNLGFLVCKEKEDLDYLRALYSLPASKLNAREHAKKLAKLEIAREARLKHYEAIKDLSNITGSESIDAIVGISEKPIFDLVSKLHQGREDSPKNLGDNIEAYLDFLESNEGNSIGIPLPFPILNEVMGGGIRRGGVSLFIARPKCLHVDHNVITPSGPKNICDIKKGDVICHPKNGTTKVKRVLKTEKLNCYKVSFRDGDSIICSEDHLWTINRFYNNKESTLSTLDLINQKLFYQTKGSGRIQYKFYIKTGVTDFNHQELEIDPYTFGAWLGDGSVSHTVKIHSADPEIIDIIKSRIGSNIVKIDYDDPNSKAIAYRINGYLSKLRLLNMDKSNCYNKFIPKHYLYNSIQNRKDLLAGLMDTDGTVFYNSKKSCRMRYVTVSKQLAYDVKFLIESLGGIGSITYQTTTCNKKIFWSYCLEIRFNDYNPFYLSRKRNRYVNRTQQVTRTIVKIEPVGNLPTKCIEVDAEDGLFLTDNCIVTHNCGKSTIGICTGLSLSTQDIPILYLDTEMTLEEQFPRIIANMNEIPIRQIEDGSFLKNKLVRSKTIERIKQLPFEHKVVAGKPFEEILSIIRRWILQKVGYENGRVKNCLVIYDYFKIMDTNELNDLQEYQAIGFQIGKLVDFCKEYDFPCLAFTQSNRDGINKESSDVISQSDRLLWLCQSAILFKKKSEEEIMEDGKENGNIKFKPIECRFGPGLEDSNYINVQADRDMFRMREINTRFDVMNNRRSKENGFETEVKDVDF